ncbi:hypothetical protein Pa4123_48880 [Phytohabitans aurantiacus]|uniref:Uncharacterized protein n=1 Tax=Phytohabitans aurantiacus TaxID=3016789 RepID=A0ABQ5R0A5_9ACTN|nr:hypothetical protein Pa4123_48880 [Phytohabitans aurantiacus]
MPPLWMVCVPLAIVGALPQPAVAAMVPASAADAVWRLPLSIAPAAATTRAAATATVPRKDLRLNIM